MACVCTPENTHCVGVIPHPAAVLDVDRLRSGTSQAAPFVAGVVALYLQNHTNATPPQIVSALTTAGVWDMVRPARFLAVGVNQ